MAEPKDRGVPVWDLPTRLFHWLLVALLCFSWGSGEFGKMDLHMYSGYAILTLLLFRLAWGLVGSRTARFADFVRPAGAVAYARRLLRRDPPHRPGHNPLGGLMVLALLAAVLVMVGTGLFANDDIFTEGPLAKLVSKGLSDTLTGIHHTAFTVLQVLAGLHILAVLAYLIGLRENLIRPMITGRKPAAELGGEPAPVLRSPMLALAVLAVAAVLVWLLVTQV